MSFKRGLSLSILFWTPSFLDDNTIDKIDIKRYIVSEGIDSAIASAVLWVKLWSNQVLHYPIGVYPNDTRIYFACVFRNFNNSLLEIHLIQLRLFCFISGFHTSIVCCELHILIIGDIDGMYNTLSLIIQVMQGYHIRITADIRVPSYSKMSMLPKILTIAHPLKFFIT